MARTPLEETDTAFDEEPLSTGEVKSRAATGALLIMGRGAALQGLAFLGNLALARLLVPEDFGIVAIGFTVVSVGRLLAGAGLGAALIARAETPDRRDLRALAGLQFTLTSIIAIVAALVAIGVGEAAMITAVMVLALPVQAFKSPAMLLFQRRLEFLAQVKIEIVETLVYLTVAVTLAALGLGAWSLAIGMVTRAVVGTTMAVALSPVGFLVPSFKFARLRSILGFGWRFQANGVSQVAADTALTAGIGAIAGLGVLGIWSFASRILSIPRLLFETMWRVGFPTFSRLMQSDGQRDMAGLLERTVGSFSVAVSAILCPLAASSPALVPLLFGSAWSDVSLIFPGAALALIVGAPVGLIGSSYLYAKGDATTGLVGNTITGVVRVAVTLSFLPSLGVVAIGIGWAAGALLSMLYTVPRARRASGALLPARVAAPAISAVAGGAAGWLVSEELGVSVASVALSSLTAISIWLLVLLALARGTLADGAAMARTIFGSAFESARSRRHGRGRPTAVPAERPAG